MSVGGLAAECDQELSCEPPARFDLHCHLDFAGNAAELAAALVARGGGALSATVTPAGYESARAALAPFGPLVRVGLGLHPWWVADGRCGEAELARFEELAATARFIVEVGLDFAPRRAGTEELQRGALDRALRAVAAGPGTLVSLHAVRAAGEVLAALRRSGALDRCACVFHWFSGTSEELASAVRAGCFFSVGERMLAARRGRAYARAIPADRLLLETDAPSGPVPAFDPVAHASSLDRALAALAAARSEDAHQLGARIEETSKRLLALT